MYLYLCAFDPIYTELVPTKASWLSLVWFVMSRFPRETCQRFPSTIAVHFHSPIPVHLKHLHCMVQNMRFHPLCNLIGKGLKSNFVIHVLGVLKNESFHKFENNCQWDWQQLIAYLHIFTIIYHYLPYSERIFSHIWSYVYHRYIRVFWWFKPISQ